MTSVISKKHAWAAVGVLLLPMGPADLFAAEKIKLNPGGYMEQGPGWADEADSDYVPDLQSDTEVFFSGKSKLDRGLVVVPRGGEVEVPMDGKTPMKWDGENWTPIPSSGPGKLGKRPKVGGIVDRSLPIGDDGKDDYIMEPDNRSQGDRRRLDSGDDPDAGSGGDESDPYGGEFDDPGHYGYDGGETPEGGSGLAEALGRMSERYGEANKRQRELVEPIPGEGEDVMDRARRHSEERQKQALQTAPKDEPKRPHDRGGQQHQEGGGGGTAPADPTDPATTTTTTTSSGDQPYMPPPEVEYIYEEYNVYEEYTEPVSGINYLGGESYGLE